MKLKDGLKRFQGAIHQGQKQMRKSLPPVAPAIFASSLLIVIGYLGWNTYWLQTELDVFTQELKGVHDTEKRLTLEKDRLNLVNSLNTGRAQIVGGALVALTAYIGWRNLKATEDKQVTERFSKAIELLGRDGANDVHVRLGGIYALERIANDSDKDYWQVMEILTAYVREKSPWTKEKDKEWAQAKPSIYKVTIPPLKIDIQAVLTVLNRRKYFYGDGEEHQLDLHKTDLRGAHLREAKMQGVLLDGAHLDGAHLLKTNLEGAQMDGACLLGANLWKANLKDAYLLDANLMDTHLYHTDLEGACLRRANLKRAWLEETILKGADLTDAENLLQEQIDGQAIIDESTQIADYLKPSNSTAQEQPPMP